MEKRSGDKILGINILAIIYIKSFKMFKCEIWAAQLNTTTYFEPSHAVLWVRRSVTRYGYNVNRIASELSKVQSI